MHLPAPSYLKLAYAVVVLSVVLPMGLASSGWVALATGGTSLGLPYLGPIALLVIGLYRVFLVVKVPGTLDAFEIVGFGKVFRKIGMVFLVLGAISAVLNLMASLLLLVAPPHFKNNTLFFFFVGMSLSMLGSLGLLGLTMFELSRLLGFEQQARKKNR